MVPLLLRWVYSLPRALVLWLFTVAVAIVSAPLLTELCSGPSRVTPYGYYVFTTQLPFFTVGLVAFYLSSWLKRRAPDAVAQRSIARLLLSFSALLLLYLAATKEGVLFAGFHLYGLVFLMLLVSLALSPNRLLVNPVTRMSATARRISCVLLTQKVNPGTSAPSHGRATALLSSLIRRRSRANRRRSVFITSSPARCDRTYTLQSSA